LNDVKGVRPVLGLQMDGLDSGPRSHSPQLTALANSRPDCP